MGTRSIVGRDLPLPTGRQAITPVKWFIRGTHPTGTKNIYDVTSIKEDRFVQVVSYPKGEEILRSF